MSKSLKIAGITLAALLVFAAAAFVGISLVSAQQQATATPAVLQAPTQEATLAPTLAPTLAANSASPVTTEKGLVVVSVTAGRAADKAGVKRGDILLRVNDTETNTGADLKTALKDAKVGDPVVLSVTHGDEAKTLTATLGDVNGQAALGLITWGGRFMDKSGANGGPFFFKGGTLPAGQAGAIITAVTADSPAAQAGLLKGDQILAVNGKDLAADYDLATAIQANKPGDKVTLKVTSGTTTKDVEVTLGDNGGKAFLGVQYSFQPVMPNSGQMPGGGFNFRRGGQGGGTFQVPQGMSGVVLVVIQPNSPAAAAGLKVNDIVTAIDGTAVNQSQQFVDAIGAHKVGDTVTLSVTHTDKTTAEVKVTLAENPSTAGKAYLGVQIVGLSEMHQNAAPGQTLPLPTPTVPGTNG